MNRLRVRVFSAIAAFAVALAGMLPAAAQDTGTLNFWFAGTKLIFERAIPLDGDVAVSIRDAGLQRFVARLGATVAYQPQQRYVIVTAADHRTITFTIGSAQYLAGALPRGRRSHRLSTATNRSCRSTRWRTRSTSNR